jgi:hypothetical protein
MRFKPTVSADGRPQTYTLDRVDTKTGKGYRKTAKSSHIAAWYFPDLTSISHYSLSSHPCNQRAGREVMRLVSDIMKNDGDFIIMAQSWATVPF